MVARLLEHDGSSSSTLYEPPIVFSTPLYVYVEPTIATVTPGRGSVAGGLDADATILGTGLRWTSQLKVKIILKPR